VSGKGAAMPKFQRQTRQQSRAQANRRKRKKKRGANEPLRARQRPKHEREIFVFWSLLKTIFRKIPTPKHFLKIDHF